MPRQEEVTTERWGVQSVDRRIEETNVPLRWVSRVVTKLNSIHSLEVFWNILYQVWMFWMERSKGTYVEIIIFQIYSWMLITNMLISIIYNTMSCWDVEILSTLQYYSFIFVKYSDSCMHTTQTTLPGQHIAHTTWNISPSSCRHVFRRNKNFDIVHYHSFYSSLGANWGRSLQAHSLLGHKPWSYTTYCPLSRSELK